MKHVFVKTNFLVDLLRPFPVRDAATLFERVANDFILHIPWVSVSEAKRTITTKIINMVLGAVLFRAQELFDNGERDLYFCNANIRDFGPTSGNALGAAYAACGLQYLSDFKVP
ncbi:hypothetical protein [Sorangium sp. So ce1335]|uniref:hypothetical protein n=1 Tax=Sorangium sp. So ce1335 TaxID=3133335 RepID=UPI003F6103EE